MSLSNTCALCDQPFDPEEPYPEWPQLMQPKREEVQEACLDLGINPTDPLCYKCWAEDVQPKAWEIRDRP